MANLQELGLTDEDEIPVDFEKLPQQYGLGLEPPQPGTYKFTLPADLANVFEALPMPNGPRIKAVLREASTLTLHKTDGTTQPFPCEISNAERDYGDSGKSSDMAYVLAAVGSVPKDGKNSSYGEAFKAAAGKSFIADVTLDASCNPKKGIYRDGALDDNQKGCGQRFDMEGYTPKRGPNKGKPVFAIPRDDSGKYATRFLCSCGAELRAWPRLRNFRPVK